MGSEINQEIEAFVRTETFGDLSSVLSVAVDLIVTSSDSDLIVGEFEEEYFDSDISQ